MADAVEPFDLDKADHVLTAMQTIVKAITAARDAIGDDPKRDTERGTFTTPCPQCKGTLRVAWAYEKRRRSRPLSYAATCDTTPACLHFMGH